MTLQDRLRAQHLQVMGGFSLTEADGFGHFLSLALVGPDEPAFWPHFTQSPEYRDAEPDPMDRWSRRVLDGIAAEHDARAVYPFGGAPFHPFHRWALRSGRFWASPLPLLVHDTCGLFASFRGALVLPDPIVSFASQNPCLTCPTQPCKTACPVNAFAGGYDLPACKAHLHAPQGQDCMTGGCLARRACPVGQDRRFAAQSAFHMEAFR